MQTKVTEIFATVKDPRSTGMCKHKLVDILFIGFCTLISNGEDFEDMVVFAKENEKWLRKYLELPNGIPSHDTFNRALQMVDCQQLSEILGKDGQFLLDCVRGSTIQIDGKKIKGVSPKSKGNDGMYILSAWVGENKLCIGQKVVEEKSNEITAIPALLNLLFVKDCVVTIDAMGCQKSIVKTILEKEANYILMVKKNQKELFEQIEKNFTKLSPSSKHDWRDLGHGRIETRYCRVINDLRFLDAQENWLGLKSIICIDSERIDKSTGKTTHASRYYISSLLYDAQQFNQAIRSHWAIENNLHWSLDVVFKEDDSLKKKGNSALNFNMLTKIALTLLDQEKSTKNSKPAKRLKCALDDKFRNKVLKI